MGKQSSRLIYQGADIKDLYYQKKQLFKLYKGNQLVWEKLGDYCLPTTALRVFDLYTNEWERGSNYTIGTMTANSNHVIAVLSKGMERHIAISKNLVDWKLINEIEYDGSKFMGFSKKDSGFYVYNRKEIYSIDIEFGLDYQVSSIIDLSGYNVQRFGLGGGISEYAYAIYYSGGWNLMQISQNGSIKSGKLGYPFNTSNLDVAVLQMVVGDECVFLITDANSSVSGRETIVYKISNMDTDYLATVFRRSGSTVYGSLSLDIIYDNYQTALFIYNANMTWLAYYQIDAMGNFAQIGEKENSGIKQITLPLYGAEGYELVDIMDYPTIPSELTIKFTIAEQYKTISEYIADGTYPYKLLDFYTASHASSESLYIDNGSYTKDCVICTAKSFNVVHNGNLAKKAVKRILIFIDNPFWEESENNYAVLIDAY